MADSKIEEKYKVKSPGVNQETNKLNKDWGPSKETKEIINMAEISDEFCDLKLKEFKILATQIFYISYVGTIRSDPLCATVFSIKWLLGFTAKCGPLQEPSRGALLLQFDELNPQENASPKMDGMLADVLPFLHLFLGHSRGRR